MYTLKDKSPCIAFSATNFSTNSSMEKLLSVSSDKLATHVQVNTWMGDHLMGCSSYTTPKACSDHNINQEPDIGNDLKRLTKSQQ